MRVLSLPLAGRPFRDLPKLLCLIGAVLAVSALLPAQDTAVAAPPPAADLTKQLLDRLSAAEARIQQLEAQMAAQSKPAAAPAPDTSASLAAPASPAAANAVAPTAAADSIPVSTVTPPAEDMTSHDHMMEIPGGPSLHFRGFFDMNLDAGSVAQQLQYPLPVPAHTGFRSGEFDLFMTSQLSENLSFLSELVLSSDWTNAFALDLERFELTYRPTKYFEISTGRYHTDIGYYNTAFHHGNWFSTATGRPFMYYFEDSGGVLPVHELGAKATGYVPGSGKLNLHWVAEVGNGSASFGTSFYGDGVQGFATNRNRKDVNFALYSRPEWIPGLQIGGSHLTGDLLTAIGTKVNQSISSAYAVYINGKWESLNEFVLMQHQAVGGGRLFNSPLSYTQLGYKIGRYRPYFRFQENNIANNDPAAPFVGRYEGPSAGVRFDAFDYAALKLQYNRVYVRNGSPQNGLELQLAFAF